jgi:hypothetical protein
VGPLGDGREILAPGSPRSLLELPPLRREVRTLRIIGRLVMLVLFGGALFAVFDMLYELLSRL